MFSVDEGFRVRPWVGSDSVLVPKEKRMTDGVMLAPGQGLTKHVPLVTRTVDMLPIWYHIAHLNSLRSARCSQQLIVARMGANATHSMLASVGVKYRWGTRYPKVTLDLKSSPHESANGKGRA